MIELEAQVSTGLGLGRGTRGTFEAAVMAQIDVWNRMIVGSRDCPAHCQIMCLLGSIH